MASPLTIIQRMFETVVEVYLDIDETVRFFMEQSGTQYRLGQLRQYCSRKVSRQRQRLIRFLNNNLPIQLFSEIRPSLLTNSLTLDINSNAFSNISWLEIPCNDAVFHRTSLPQDLIRIRLKAKISVDNPLLKNETFPFTTDEFRCSTPKCDHKNDNSPNTNLYVCEKRHFSRNDCTPNISNNNEVMDSTSVIRVLTDTSTLDNKISALEEELEKMRNQIATILLIQQQSSKASDVVSRGPSLPPPPPPPLPPPPPPPPVGYGGAALKLQIKVNKENSSNKRHNTSPQCNGVQMPNMTEVLKGMNKVKLRPIQRSPGGTPIRPKNYNSDDPNVILADALKKRLSRIAVEQSPHSDSTLNFSSGDNSFSSPHEFS